MKSTIVVLIVLLMSMPVWAQYDGIKTTTLPDDADKANHLLNSFLQTEKNQRGMLQGKISAPLDGKRFVELYEKQNPANKKTTRRVTFMDGPVVFSTTSTEINNSTSVYQQKTSLNSTNSTVLGILGIAASIAAQGIFPKYALSGESSAVQAYLQSTYHQDHQK